MTRAHKQRLKAFVAFIAEREAIRRRRQQKEREPWTKDPILSKFRFCNVRREDDRVTQWLRVHWREPFADYPHLWFAMVVARLINHPPTLEELSLPGRWNPKQFLHVLRSRAKREEKTFGSAYIVSTNGRATDKGLYLVESVLNPLWAERQSLIPQKGDTLVEYCAALRQFNGMGGFIAAQVIADIKYVEPLKSAPDWWTFAASGPGSRRGLNRVVGLDVDSHWNEMEWYATLRVLGDDTRKMLQDAKVPRLHLQDLQNCLCEYDKYERARLGEGRPRQLFTPYAP